MSESDQINPARLKNWFSRCLGIAAQLREARADLAEMKKEDTRKQVDWSRLRALAVAHDADMHDDKKHDRVKTMLGKGTYASWYADIVGIGNSEQITAPRSSSETEGRKAEVIREPSAPLAATVGDDRGNPVADTDSDALAINQPPAPSQDSERAAEVAPSVASAAPIRESDVFNDIRGSFLDRSLRV